MNFAPVCDIAGDEDDFMYSRSLGQDAETTSEFIRQTVSLYSENSMGCVLKHFPGYGDNPDTHKGIALDERELTEFETRGFPAVFCGNSGRGGVCWSPTIVSCLDKKRFPRQAFRGMAQSAAWRVGVHRLHYYRRFIHGGHSEVLRHPGSRDSGNQGGNDLLCCTDYGIQLPAVIEAVRTGEISEERIEESVRRILAWKLRLGLLPEDAVLS